MKKDPVDNSRQPSPDNRGLSKEKPKDVDEEAAKINRDVDALVEQLESPKKRKRPGSKR